MHLIHADLSAKFQSVISVQARNLIHEIVDVVRAYEFGKVMKPAQFGEAIDADVGHSLEDRVGHACIEWIWRRCVCWDDRE